MKDTFERVYTYFIILMLSSAFILLGIASLSFLDTKNTDPMQNSSFNWFPFLLMIILCCIALTFMIDLLTKKQVKQRQYCPVCDKKTSKNEKGECSTCLGKVRQ